MELEVRGTDGDIDGRTGDGPDAGAFERVFQIAARAPPMADDIAGNCGRLCSLGALLLQMQINYSATRAWTVR